MRYVSMATLAGTLVMLAVTSAGLLAQESKSPADSAKGGMMGKEKGGMMCPMMQAMQGENSTPDRKTEMKKRMQEKMKKKAGGESGRRHSGHH